MMYGWGWDSGGAGIAGFIFMMVFMAVVVAAIVFLVVWLVRGASGPGHAAGPPPAEAPLEILKKRYAKGEIDKAEFEEKKRGLQ